MPIPFFQQSVRVCVTLSLAAVVLSGCYQYRTHVPEKIGASTMRSETVWSLAWGLAKEDPKVQDCHGQGLAEVTVRDNFGFTLITVVTLGFASPKKVEWTCATPNPSDGDLSSAEGGGD